MKKQSNFRNKLRKIKFKDIINPKKWLHFIQGNLINIFFGSHYMEQYQYRVSRDECKKCVERGYCDGCGCPMPMAAFVSSNQCSKGHWDKMYNRKNWKKFKKLFNFKIIVESE